MADDKKPKIDLKARLGKTGMSQAPAPGSTSGIPAPNSSQPQAMPSGIPAPAGIPAPSGMPGMPGMSGIPAPSIPSAARSSGGPGALDALSGLNTVGQSPFRQQTPPPPPQPQRIEMDETTVNDARKGGFRTGAIVGVVLALAFGGVGYIAGGASEKSNGRKIAQEDAKSLATDVGAAKKSLESLQKKAEEGRDALIKGTFPDSLAGDLGGLRVDFDGLKLGGRRFSGFKISTTQQLISYVTAVQDLNDKKDLIARLLSKLQKPIKEQIAANGKVTIGHVVLLGRKDDSGNPMGLLAPLQTPITVTPPKFDMPAEFTFTDPISKGNAKIDRFKSGNIDKPAAIYILPKSIETTFPSELTSAKAQLIVQIAGFIKDIKGEAAAGGDQVQDTKPGLLERSDQLIKALEETSK